MIPFDDSPQRPQTGSGGIDTSEYDRFRSGVEIRSQKQALQPMCVIHSGDSEDATNHDFVDTSIGHAEAKYFTTVSDSDYEISPALRLRSSVTNVTGSFVMQSTAKGYSAVRSVGADETSSFGDRDIPPISVDPLKDGGVSDRYSGIRVEKYSRQRISLKFDDTRYRRYISRIAFSQPDTSYNTEESGVGVRYRGTSGFVCDTPYGTDSVAYCGLTK
jgi:hypothetical protein